MVRSRDRGHLEALQERFPELAGFTIHESPNNDYRFRLFCPKELWAPILGKLALDVDYDNFKDAVGAWQGKQGRAYQNAHSDVWVVMYDFQKHKHGPGIYHRLKAEHEGDVFEVADDLFPDEDADEEEAVVAFARHVPDADDDVLLVQDGDLPDPHDGPVMGVIWWLDNWTSPEEAYAAAVQAGVLPLVAHPIFGRVEWGKLDDDPDRIVPVYDFEARDVPPAEDVVG